MIIIYTGNGKGKTSACVGQALRALGQHFHVGFAQFMKSDVAAGEQTELMHLLGRNFRIGGMGFFHHEEDRPQHGAAARATRDWALAWLAESPLKGDSSGKVSAGRVSGGSEGRMLVLDEALYALGNDLLSRDDIERLIEAARAAGCHLVLSGRGLPEWLEAEADLVSEIQERKHPAKSGVKAQRGIEY